MDRGAQWATVHGVDQLSTHTFTYGHQKMGGRKKLPPASLEMISPWILFFTLFLNKLIEFLINELIYFWLRWVFSWCTGFFQLQQAGATLAVVRGLLIAVPSLVAEPGLQDGRLQQVRLVGSVLAALRRQSSSSEVMAHGPSYPQASGSSWTRDRTCVSCNEWHAVSLPLSHQKSPIFRFLCLIMFYQYLCRVYVALAQLCTNNNCNNGSIQNNFIKLLEHTGDRKLK